MKRNSLKFIPLLLVFALMAGCGGKKKIEEMASNAEPKAKQEAVDKDRQAGAVVVPDEKPASEAVTSQDISPEGIKGGQYKTLGDGDTLTRQVQETGELYTVHFDFDKYSIRDEDQKLLTLNAKWLSLNPGVKIRIEGYADERGETEYNLALGDKRARSVARYIEDMGITGNRLSVISFGEENPVAREHTEDAWAKNRRAEFKVIGTGK